MQPIEEELSVKKRSPKFLTSDPYSEPGENNIRGEYYKHYAIEDRTMLWEQHRRRKIENTQNMLKDSELNECTFHPILASNPNDYIKGSQKIDGKVNITSIDKFLSRMYSARIERENKKIELDNAVGSGKNWKNQVTIPRPPRLAEKKQNRVKYPFKIRSQKILTVSATFLYSKLMLKSYAKIPLIIIDKQYEK